MLTPWHDRRGRLVLIKAVALALCCVPIPLILYPLLGDGFAGRPLNGLVHESGKWAVRLTVAAVALTPITVAMRWSRLALTRRIVGVSAAAYALAHFAFYVAEQGFAVRVVISEILNRSYLTIGFVALVGLMAMAVTSLDAAMRQMGRWWKRLHRLIYPVTALALLHFFMQTKANVFEPTLIAGLATWILLWRLVPAGYYNTLWIYFALAIVAFFATISIEYAWYALATSVNPDRLLAANWSLRYAPRPAHWVGTIALLGAMIVTARAMWTRNIPLPRRAAGVAATIKPPPR